MCEIKKKVLNSTTKKNCALYKNNECFDVYISNIYIERMKSLDVQTIQQPCKISTYTSIHTRKFIILRWDSSFFFFFFFSQRKKCQAQCYKISSMIWAWYSKSG